MVWSVAAFSEMQIARAEAREAAEDVHEYEISQPKIQAEVIIPEVQAIQISSVSTYPVPLDTELQLFIVRLCEDHHIDPAIIFAMIDRESDFAADAIGDNGKSFGLMQIQKRFHLDRMEDLGCTDLLDPYQNVTVGIDYLEECLDKGKGIEWALMAYNGGASYANSMTKKGIVSDYASEVLTNSKNLKEGVETMYYTDNPILDAERHQAAQDKLLEALPVCADCDNPIQDEEAYYINGEWICENCMESYKQVVLPE